MTVVGAQCMMVVGGAQYKMTVAAVAQCMAMTH